MQWNDLLVVWGVGQRVEGTSFPLSPVKNISGRVLLLRYWFPFKISSSLRSKRFRASSSDIRPITQARLADTSEMIKSLWFYFFNFFFLALILEEIAIDTPIRQKEEEILKEAQELHLASLDLAR